MTSVEAQALTNRLDTIDNKLDVVVEKVTIQITQMKPVVEQLHRIQETVTGENGHQSRLVALETVSGLRTRGFWVMVGLVSTVVSGAVLAIGTWVVTLI